MENTNNSLTAVSPRAGHSISILGGTYRIIISGEQTNGAYTLIDMLIPPKGGPRPHSHPTFQEAYYVLDGEIILVTKENTYTATKGSHVNIPFNGPVHKFTNRTDKTAHMLCLIAPAGMEKMFEEIGKPVVADTILPSPQITTEELKRLQNIAEKYGQNLYPSDYLD